ncbi:MULTISPECIES: sulfurtransferase TusA family protein [Virgibacillus]|uniref:Thiosulfate sulfurtransferase GlpE n=2 Tax=Virgibacillus TaxID=84406 RepID=A0A024QD29_9BACI|nr:MULTISPECIES: sulfurtransferase TusA family protein [Virgibacillus]EQB36731.1 hypothetical protein M948_17000 [Virgibacillus sp. CM-4]MYL42557.1 hypothetical protein [Virgibacillus massiliensis]GGJ74179.1 hypothetical protein GCM10007111_39700 [Virgibacillus kapii]CDQ40438.1 Thiosulfate sulfurtransferase GlpE [Virgibacillus massiliensis]
MSIQANKVLDAKGLACPMPIVKTKKAIKDLEPGHVIEVQATDKGSTADIEAWAESTGHHYLGTVEEEDGLKHYLRKASDVESRGENNHQKVVNLDHLQQKLDGHASVVILDVREPAEFAFGHIPDAINIPLGELSDRMDELNKNEQIYVICRTGNRSDLAAKKLSEEGYDHVTNVVPGMNAWEGTVEEQK